MKTIYSQGIISQTRHNFFSPIDTKGACILEDALNIWSKFETQASLMSNILYVPLDHFDDQEKYGIHKAWVNAQEAGIGRDRFFSVFELIEFILHSSTAFLDDNFFCFEIKDVYDEVFHQKRDLKIKFSLQQEDTKEDCNTAIQLNVDYSDDTENGEGLPAPITLIPYKQIQQNLIKYVKSVFSNWQECEEDPSYLVRNYNSDMLKGNLTLPGSYFIIEECCKKLDKNFSLDYSYDMSTCIEKIKKNDLKRAESAFISIKTLRSEPIKENNKQLLTFLASNKKQNNVYQLPKDLERIVCENIIGYSLSK